MITLLLFFLLVGSILPAAFMNFFGSKTEVVQDEEPKWITYTDSELRVNITRVEQILTVEGFSSSSKEEVKAALESISGVRSVRIRSPIQNPNPLINATFLHNATLSLEDGTDLGYVSFKIDRRLRDIFPELVNFSGNPLVTQKGKAEPLEPIQGGISGIEVTKTLNGSGIEFDVVLFPETKVGDETTILASVITYDDEVLAGSGFENPRYLFPPILTKDLMLNGTIDALLDEYSLLAMVPWKNRNFDRSILNGTFYEYEISGIISANVSGFDQDNLSLGLDNFLDIAGISFDEDTLLIDLVSNSSGENVTAYLESLSVNYLFMDLPLFVSAFNVSESRIEEIVQYLSFTENLTTLRSARITLPEEIIIDNETYMFYDNPVQDELSYNISIGDYLFNVTLLIEYDEVVMIYGLDPQEI
jgi:hypothetical protein